MTLEGWGQKSGSSFGFGRDVFRVDSLSPGTEEGTFRWALNQANAAGGGLIVFEVSGVIDYSTVGYIYVNMPNVTIAGQTAPSPGIVLNGCDVYISSHDILMQHIRVRAGSDDPTINTDPKGSITRCLSLNGWYGDCYNVVVDHCSAAWGVDGTFQIGKQYAGLRLDNITWSNNIVAEALVGLTNNLAPYNDWVYLHEEGISHIGEEHCLGGTVHGEQVSLIKNLFASGASRMPKLQTGFVGEYINNLTYNSEYYNGYVAILTSNWADHQRPFDVVAIGNYAKEGPMTTNQKPIFFVQANCQDPGQKVYYNDNKGNQTGWVEYRIDAPAIATVLSAPGDSAGYSNNTSIWAADDVVQNIMAYVGAWPAERDSVDQRVINSIKFTTGPKYPSNTDIPGYQEAVDNPTTGNHLIYNLGEIINTENDVGGYPTLSGTYRPLIGIPTTEAGQIAWLETYTQYAETGGAVVPTPPGHSIADWAKVEIS